MSIDKKLESFKINTNDLVHPTSEQVLPNP